MKAPHATTAPEVCPHPITARECIAGEAPVCTDCGLAWPDPPPAQLSTLPRLQWLRALSAAQGECSTLPKTGHNTFHGYHYVELPNVLDLLRPILARHGLLATFEVDVWDISQPPATCVLTLFLAHVGGHSQGYACPGVSANVDKTGKLTDKAIYAAITGARKYALMNLFGLAAGGTDEPEHTANESAEPRRSQAAASSSETKAQRLIRERAATEANLQRLREIYVTPKTPPAEGFGDDGGGLDSEALDESSSQLPQAEQRKRAEAAIDPRPVPASRFTPRGGEPLSSGQVTMARMRVKTRLAELGDSRAYDLVSDLVAALFGAPRIQELGKLDLDPLLAHVKACDVLP